MTFSNCLHVRLLSDRTDEQSINTIFSHDSRMAVGDPEVSRLDIGVLEMRPVYIFTHISLIVMIAKMMMISVQKRRIRS